MGSKGRARRGPRKGAAGSQSCLLARAGGGRSWGKAAALTWAQAGHPRLEVSLLTQHVILTGAV